MQMVANKHANMQKNKCNTTLRRIKKEWVEHDLQNLKVKYTITNLNAFHVNINHKKEYTNAK